MRTVGEPAVTVLPCAPVAPCTAAGWPLISTLAEQPATGAPPQPVGSPRRAAGWPSISTSGEPAAIGVLPWPGSGQTLESPRRAAGLPDIDVLLTRSSSGRCLPGWRQS